ncbi:MAG: hypothetical protein AB7Q00_09710 [Phycisphaerales bacterium]
MKDALVDTILEYLNTVSEAISRLRRDIGESRLRLGPSGGNFPRNGTLSDNTTYSFHGIGCEVNLGHTTVDFDFGVDGRIDGFDAWRLWLYMRQYPQYASKYPDENAVRAALQQLIASGTIVESQHSGDHLLYLTQRKAIYL